MKVTNYSKDENEIRLIRYRKKGILRLIFSRLVGILLLVIFQVLIILTFFELLGELFKYYTAFKAVFTVVMVFYLFNNEMDSSAKLTWLFIISLWPFPGTIFLLFTKIDIGHVFQKKKIQRIIAETKEVQPVDEDIMKELSDRNCGMADICRYVNRTGNFPVYKNTEVKYYPSGEEMYEQLMEELDKAEKFIFLEYFIIDEGYMWGRILKKLVDKVNQGVEVRVLYDGMCEMQLLPQNYDQRLRSFGIAAKAFSPIKPFVSTYYNYRDHRKVLVIDGRVAFNGGVNLADEYINKVERFGYWKDAAVMVRGDAVKAYTLMFLQMWYADTGMIELGSYMDAPGEYTDLCPSGYVMPYSDIPLDDDKVGESVYIDILNRARSYVHIMTPYLILDGELEHAITFAAERGVEVSIMLPGIPDKKMVYALAKSHYMRLLKSGVHIYEYEPGFVHSKCFVSDDERAVVGSINLDYRSLYHHFECATYMYESDAVMDVERDFETSVSRCREVTYESVYHEKLFYKCMGRLAKLIAPLV